MTTLWERWVSFVGWLHTGQWRPTEPSFRERREIEQNLARRKAEKEGRIYDASPDAPSGPVRLQLVVRGRGVWQPVDLDGYSLEVYVENILYLDKGPLRFANSVIRAVNEANRRLTLLEAERAEQARLRAEVAYERAVAQEKAEQSKGRG